MARPRFFGGPLWLQWARTAVFLLLFAEYLRLVATTDVLTYRTAVMIVWAVLSLISLVSLVKTIREKNT